MLEDRGSGLLVGVFAGEAAVITSKEESPRLPSSETPELLSAGCILSSRCHWGLPCHTAHHSFPTFFPTTLNWTPVKLREDPEDQYFNFFFLKCLSDNCMGVEFPASITTSWPAFPATLRSLCAEP